METKERICDFIAKVSDAEVGIVRDLHSVFQLLPEKPKESQLSGGMERA